jgi:hypothetical protein
MTIPKREELDPLNDYFLDRPFAMDDTPNKLKRGRSGAVGLKKGANNNK